MLVTLLGGLGLLLWTAQVRAADEISVTAVVTGPPPAGPVAITSPKNGERFQAVPIQVRGSCSGNIFVRLYRNGALAGSTQCASSLWGLGLDLVGGRNDLVARAYDFLDQAGPESQMVSVYFDPPGGASQAGGQLLISSEYAYRSVQPEELLRWPFELFGGRPPYAISVDWGDGSSDLISRAERGVFSIQHIYRKVGFYRVKLRVTDVSGRTTGIELFAIARGEGAGVSLPFEPGGFIILWPIWFVVLLALISFWLGERYEKRLLTRGHRVWHHG